MKIAIVSGPHRKDKDSPLLKEAGNFFEKVTFVPITQIRVDIADGLHVKFGNTDLSEFGCVMPIPGKTYKEVFYIMMRVLSKSTYIPMHPEKYLFSTDEAALFNYLNRNGINTRELFVVSSQMPMSEVLKRTKFPLTVVEGHKRIVVTTPKTLKDVVSLAKVGTPIVIEPAIYAARSVFVFMVGDNAIASYERKGKQTKVIEVDDELKEIAVKVRNLIGCDYCSLSFYNSRGKWYLSKFTMSPDFGSIQRITHKDVARALLEHMAEKSRKSIDKRIGDKISRLFRR
jgi:hypothetical protein